MKKKIIRFVVTLATFIVFAITCIFIYNQICLPVIPSRRAVIALDFCKKHNLNTDYCVFVDFSKHPGKRRYVIYNLNTREIEYSSVCANGLNKNEFSNVEGSHLSSLGKYKVTSIITKMKIGEEGIIIEGLESTNSNARDRELLIHSHSSIYNNPGTYPFNFFRKNLSWGCFVIDKETFEKTKEISKPMLLWAYN